MTLLQLNKNLTLSLLKTTAFTAVLLTAIGIAFAQPMPTGNDLPPSPPGFGPPPPPPSPEHMKQKLTQELSLTPAQQAKIDSIHKTFFDAHRPQLEARRAKFDELHALHEKGASEETMKAKHQALASDFKAMQAERQQLESQIKSVLTPEQSQKFDAMRKKHEEAHQQRMKQGPGPGKPVEL